MINNMNTFYDSNRYNMGLLCDYTIENFWGHFDKNISVSEAKRLYHEFLDNNSYAVNESIDAYCRDMQPLYESFADLRKSKGGGDPTQNAEDAFAADSEAVDAIATGNNIADLKWEVYNSKSGTPGAYDINFHTDCFYQNLEEGKYGDKLKNTDKILPPSLYDTSKVSDFTAVFAFMDLPNMDLSGWSMRSAEILDGLFYKSTFNNDSIKDWNFSVTYVKSLDNMFAGGDFDKSIVLDKWQKYVDENGAHKGLKHLPTIGKMSTDETDAALDRAYDDVMDAGGMLDRIEKMNSIKRNNVMYSSESMRHRVMSSSEFINENFGDTLRKFGSMVKKAASNLLIKLRNGFYAFFDRSGLTSRANMPINIVKFINDGGVNGVYAAQGKPLNYTGHGDGEYYDDIKKGDTEYNNYKLFVDAITSSSIKPSNEDLNFDDFANGLYEDKIGLNAKEDRNGQTYVNIGAPDVDTEYLKEYINMAIDEVVQEGRSHAQCMVVWGAPGIGKTSIPKTLVKAANEAIAKKGGKAEDRMATIVVDCSILQAGDLSMPMPARDTPLEDILSFNPGLVQKIKELGLTEDDLKGVAIARSDDAPKTWLPVWKPTGDRRKNQLLDEIANGATTAIYGGRNNEEVIGYESSGNGGILMFDEFLRADPDLLMGIAQLMMNREMLTGYKLGSKWIVMGCSNRPTDDTQIEDRWDKMSPALKQRFCNVNFVPTYSDWVKWAREKGGFDETTLDYIGAVNPYGDNSRWHNVDPAKSTGENEGRTVSPRQWSKMVEELNWTLKRKGLTSYNELGRTFLIIASKYLPDEIAKDYVTEYIKAGGKSNPYRWDTIVANPTATVASGTRATTVVNGLTNYVRANFGAKNIPPADELRSVIEFLDNNFPKNTDVIGEFIAKTYFYCKLDAEDVPAVYGEIWDDYENKHPKLGLVTLYQTLAEQPM